MSTTGLAVLIAGFAKLQCKLILHCTAYAAGDPRAEKRQKEIEEVNRIADEIDKQANAVIEEYKRINRGWGERGRFNF